MITWPNLTVTRVYAAHGYLTQYKHGATVLEEITDTDTFGSATETRFVDSALWTSRSFDATTGRLTSIQTDTLAMTVLVDREAVEIHADAIPGGPVSIPWSEVEYVRVVPEDGAEAIRAHLRVRQLPRMPIYIPWVAEFDRFAPVERHGPEPDVRT